MHCLRSLALYGAFLALGCSSAAPSNEPAPTPKETAALFALAPSDTEVALAAKDLDLLLGESGRFLRHLARVPSMQRLIDDLDERSQERLERSVFDQTFLSNLNLAPENGAAVFFVERNGRTAFLGAVALRDRNPEAVVGKALHLWNSQEGIRSKELTINKRTGDGPMIYDVVAPSLPPLVAGFRDDYLLLSDQEELLKNALANQGASPFWEQVQQRSPLAREDHDALLYVSFDGRLGEELRRQYGGLAFGGEFVKSCLAVSASLRLRGDALWLRTHVSTPQGKDLRPYFARNEGRGDLLAVADEKTATAVRATINPLRLWQRLSELPSSSADSPARLAEDFQAETGARLVDRQSGILDHLTGDVAYFSEPGVNSAALLFGIRHNKTEPFERLLASLWRLLETRVAASREGLREARLDLQLSPPRSEGGHAIYHLELRHLEIPLPLVLEAATTRDAVVLSAGAGWIDRSSSRAGKSPSTFIKRVYHPEARALFQRDPQAVAYLQFLDPVEGLESTPGEVTQALAAYAADPAVGESVAIGRAALEHLYDAALAFFVHDDGLELVIRVTLL